MSDAGGPGPGARRALVVLTALLVVSVAVLVVLKHGNGATARPRAAGLHGSQLPSGIAGSPAIAFDLADGRGGRISSADLRGRPYALTFLYTHCPDVCPLIGSQLRVALDDLGADASRVAVVGVSVDPQGDTPQSVRSWLARQREPANFHYAVGTERELSPVWKAYYASPQISGRPETSVHTAAVWLVDARGRRRADYSAGSGLRPADIASDLRSLIP